MASAAPNQSDTGTDRRGKLLSLVQCIRSIIGCHRHYGVAIAEPDCANRRDRTAPPLHSARVAAGIIFILPAPAPRLPVRFEPRPQTGGRRADTAV